MSYKYMDSYIIDVHVNNPAGENIVESFEAYAREMIKQPIEYVDMWLDEIFRKLKHKIRTMIKGQQVKVTKNRFEDTMYMFAMFDHEREKITQEDEQVHCIDCPNCTKTTIRKLRDGIQYRLHCDFCGYELSIDT